MTGARLSSWGNYPPFRQEEHRCHWRMDVPAVSAQLKEGFGTFLPFGNGRSYGDSCLAASDHVLQTTQLDRFIAADWASGRIIAEAGMTLQKLIEVSLPQGWFPPVTPGTKYVTLGGAVANDVHGKNHHVRGTFGRYVARFGLQRSDRQEELVCSLEENSALFAATIGGLGLTGIITWVELQMMQVRSAFIDSESIPFATLEDFFALSSESDGTFEYTASWVDCGGVRNNVGRGVFFRGNHAPEATFEAKPKRKIAVPFSPPFSLINGISARLFNALYYGLHEKRVTKREGYDPFFYPLDGILHWNRLYGQNGFQQYQCVIPQSAALDATRELLYAIAEGGGGSPLTVLKQCGDVPSPGLMSFPLKGVSLALDFPQTRCLNEELLPRLDAIVRQAGGRLYPAKDAHMTAQDFKAFYPAWERVEKIRDPALCSRFWKRVTAL